MTRKVRVEHAGDAPLRADDVDNLVYGLREFDPTLVGAVLELDAADGDEIPDGWTVTSVED